MKALSGLLALSALGVAGARWAKRRSPYSFDGKVVYLTGGSRGLGLELARELGSQGARLVLVARDADELARARDDLHGRGVEASTLALDVSHPEAARDGVSEALRHFGRIDVVVNCAGQIQVGPVGAMTLDDFRQGLRANFWGAANTIDAALPFMRARGEGRIVNVSSVGGLVGVPHLAPYVTGKFALTGYSLTLRAELAQHGITVVTVCPGLMRTGSARQATFKGDPAAEESWFRLSASLPVLSMDSTRAARRIVRAVADGDARLILTLQAKVAALLEALWPDGATLAASWANRLLPQDRPPTPSEGRPTEANLPQAIRALDERAAARNNEVGGAPARM